MSRGSLVISISFICQVPKIKFMFQLFFFRYDPLSKNSKKIPEKKKSAEVRPEENQK